jgi:hypothetical protein
MVDECVEEKVWGLGGNGLQTGAKRGDCGVEVKWWVVGDGVF